MLDVALIVLWVGLTVTRLRFGAESDGAKDRSYSSRQLVE